MLPTWGSPEDVAQLNTLYDKMAQFCEKHDLPAFLGEFNVVADKEHASRVRWLSAVMRAANSRKMVPVLWDTGGEVSRNAPHTPSAALVEMLRNSSRPTASRESTRPDESQSVPSESELLVVQGL
jgi:hypothetical protein